MNIDMKEQDGNIIYSTTQKMFTKVVDIQEKETIRVIEEYCAENNIIPNLIDKNKLDLVLRLGIQELNLRELKEADKELKNGIHEMIFGVDKE